MNGFDLFSLIVFAVAFQGNLLIAIPSWLFFTLLLKPSDWRF